MQQFFVVKPDGSRLGPFEGETINQMRLDGAIGIDDKIEEVSVEPDAGGEAETSPPASPMYSAPAPTSAKKMSPLFWVLIGVCVLCIPCMGIFAAILFPVFAQAKQSAQLTASLNDYQEIGQAMTVYLSDFDDTFPPRMDSLSDTWAGLAGYARRDMPVSKNPGHPEISGNGGLSGTLSTKLDAPQRTFEFFDSGPWAADQRAVLFVDGGVKKMKESDFQAGLLNGMIEQ